MDGAVTQQDINHLRTEFTAQFDRLWADTRDNMRDHLHDDDRRFGSLAIEMQSVNKQLSEATGAFSLIKWMIGLGIPAIFGGIITLLLRQHT